MVRALLGMVMSVIFLVCCTDQAQKSDWDLIWSDEFNYKGLPDTTKWNYDTGSNNGWGNNELQYYTFKKVDNARVEDGNLIIEAKNEKN